MPCRSPQPQRSLEELLRDLDQLRANPPQNKPHGHVIPRGHSLVQSPLQKDIEASLEGREHQLAPNGNTQEVWLSENRPTLFYFRQMGSVQITYHDGHPAIAFHYLYTKWETVILRFPNPDFRAEETLLLAMAIVSGDLLALLYGELLPHLDKDEFNYLPEFSPMAVVGLRSTIESLQEERISASGYYANLQSKLQNELEAMKAKDVANSAEITSLREREGQWSFVAKMFIVFFLLACAVLWLLAIWAGEKINPEKTARLGVWHMMPPAYLANGAVGPLGTPSAPRL
jgi:hypothetical protein